MPNLASILYLPRLHVSQDRTGAFLENLLRYKHRYPILIYSDAPWHESLTKALEPAKFFKCIDPETAKTEMCGAAVPNYVYLQGVQIVLDQGIDYFLVLETDCRVKGDYWDDEIFDEFLTHDDPVLGGTMFVWHAFNFGMDYAMEFLRFAETCNVKCWRKTVPAPNLFLYGGRGSCEKHRVSAYANGALSIAKTAFVKEAYGNRDIKLAAQEGSAWDAQLGYFLFEVYGPAGFRRLAPLDSVFSVYGDLLTAEQERLYMLRCGQVRGIHQVKSEVVE